MIPNGNQRCIGHVPIVSENNCFKEMQESFIGYEYIDITGDIYNKWQSFAESKGLGLNKTFFLCVKIFSASKECKTLIEAFNSAVKSTKHGLTSDLKYPNPEDFPHYMYGKPSRKSSHSNALFLFLVTRNLVLGQLFDEAENICDTLYKPITDPVELDDNIVALYGGGT
jgi:hypothetical protein